MSSRKYPSRYSQGKNITAAQYMAELMCERQARIEKKELPQKFWEQSQWKKSYMSQILAANGLLKIYDELAIMKALKSKEADRIYSLRNSNLDRLIKYQENELKKQRKKPSVEIDRKDTKARPRAHSTKKSNVGKLRDLDD